jgi:hypothetical protein
LALRLDARRINDPRYVNVCVEQINYARQL